MSERLPLRVALPPSEGKAEGGDGPPLDLARLTAAEVLTPARTKLVDALVRLCSGTTPRSRTRARTVLGLSPGLAGEIEVDAAIRTAPTLPAAARYTGVLYDHLDLGTLGAEARRRAAERVLVVSALWGVVRPDDPIPRYRLGAGAMLPRIGRPAAFWRAPLARALPEPLLVVDCRSSGYRQAWSPAAGSSVVLVRPLAVAPDGSRKVISHMAKATRGDVARALLTRAGGGGADAGTPEEVADVVTSAGLACALVAPPRPGAAWTLDVLLQP